MVFNALLCPVPPAERESHVVQIFCVCIAVKLSWQQIWTAVLACKSKLLLLLCFLYGALCCLKLLVVINKHSRNTFRWNKQTNMTQANKQTWNRRKTYEASILFYSSKCIPSPHPFIKNRCINVASHLFISCLCFVGKLLHSNSVENEDLVGGEALLI